MQKSKLSKVRAKTEWLAYLSISKLVNKFFDYSDEGNLRDSKGKESITGDYDFFLK